MLYSPFKLRICCTVPLKLRICWTVPLKIRISWTVPLKIRICWTVPLKLRICCTVPLKLRMCCTVPLKLRICCTVPLKLRISCTVSLKLMLKGRMEHRTEKMSRLLGRVQVKFLFLRAFFLLNFVILHSYDCRDTIFFFFPEIGTFVGRIVNLECLILISNVGSFIT